MGRKGNTLENKTHFCVWYPWQVYHGENVSKGNRDTIIVSDKHTNYLYTALSTLHLKYLPKSHMVKMSLLTCDALGSW